MEWQIYIGLGVFFGSLFYVMQRALLRDDKSEPVLYSATMQLWVALGFITIGFLSGKLHFTSFSGIELNVILIGLLYGLGSFFVFQAMDKVQASRFMVVFGSRVLFTILASGLFLGEAMRAGQFLGVIVVLISIIVVNWDKIQELAFKKEDLYSFAAAVCFGLANTNDKMILGRIDLWYYLVLAFLLPGLLISITHLRKVSKVKVLLVPKILIPLIGACLMYGLSALFTAMAFRIGPSGPVATFNVTMVILSVLLSIVLLGERDAVAQKVIGALLSVAGLFLVAVL